MNPVLLLARGTVVAIVLGSVLAHATLTDRWASPTDTGISAASVGELPPQVGPWLGQPGTLPVEARDSARALAGVEHYLITQYVHRSDQRRVTVLVVFGRSQPIAAHTPDICYAGADYRVGPRQALTIPVAGHPEADGDAFWWAEFSSDSLDRPDRLLIAWGWTASGTWSAPRFPRTAFLDQTSLAKVYLICDRDPDHGAPRIETLLDFLPEFLPAASRSLKLDVTAW